MALKKIGFLCVGLKGWISLDRTKEFYLKSLKKSYEIILIHTKKDFFQELHHFDLIINFFGNLAWEYKHEIKIPVIFCLHGGAVLDYSFLIKNAKKINTSDSFIVNCTSDLAILKEIFKTPPNSYLLKLPISENIKLNHSKTECKSVLNLGSNTLVLGYIARILPQKNLHQALHILNNIKNEVTKDVKLIIVGNYWIDYPILNWQKKENEYYLYINELINTYKIRENIHQFESNLSNEELSLCYGSLDFLLHPTNSLDENFGYTPIEAMSCGVPVIATAYGVVKDSITHNKTGFLLETWSSKSGIRAEYYQGVKYIKKLYKNPVLKEKTTRNCVKRVKENYSFKNCSQDLITIVNLSVQTQSSEVWLIGNLDFLKYEENNYLPNTKPSWNYFKKVAEIYCSNSIDNLELSDKTILRTFSEFYIDHNQIIFLDPTWPAKIPFTAQTKEILENCMDATSYHQLKTRVSFQLTNHILFYLISIGALLFSKHLIK